MKIVGEIFITGEQLRLLVFPTYPKIVVHNARPDTFVELLCGMSDKQKADIGRFVKEKSFHKEGKV